MPVPGSNIQIVDANLKEVAKAYLVLSKSYWCDDFPEGILDFAQDPGLVTIEDVQDRLGNGVWTVVVWEARRYSQQ